MISTRKVRFFILRKITRLVIEAIVRTSRVTIINREIVADLKKNHRPIIYVFWHRHIFFTIHRFKNSGARPLISRSSDGEIVSQIAEEFGMNPVRGSSSSGGARAFLKLLKTIRETETDILITADGPKGPPREIKDGTIILAQKTGSVIVPFCWTSSRKKVFRKTWDRFLLPLPFGHITLVYGEPFYPGEAKKGKAAARKLETEKKRLRDRMNRLEEETETLGKKSG